MIAWLYGLVALLHVWRLRARARAERRRSLVLRVPLAVRGGAALAARIACFEAALMAFDRLIALVAHDSVATVTDAATAAFAASGFAAPTIFSVRPSAGAARDV